MILVFIFENWSTEIEYDEKGIVIEDVDERMMGSVSYGSNCPRSRKIQGKGLVIRCALAATWGGLKASGGGTVLTMERSIDA